MGGYSPEEVARMKEILDALVILLERTGGRPNIDIYLYDCTKEKSEEIIDTLFSIWGGEKKHNQRPVPESESYETLRWSSCTCKEETLKAVSFYSESQEKEGGSNGKE